LVWQTLTSQIAGSDTSAHIQILAHRIAEAQVDLLRVRSARRRLLSEKLINPKYPAIPQNKVRVVAGFARAFEEIRRCPQK
jgi:hypothetical protein